MVFRGKDGGEISGGGWRPRRREKKKSETWLQEPGRKSLFCADFELPSTNRLTMKIAPIYRAGKRVILSSMRKTSQPLIRLEESKPLVQSVHLELPNLAAQGCELPEVATLSHSTEPFLNLSTRPDHSPG